MSDIKAVQLSDDTMESVSGGQKTETYNFYSVKKGALIGVITIVDGKVVSKTGDIPQSAIDKYVNKK